MEHKHAGYATIVGPRGTLEITTATCGHCNCVFPVKRSDGGSCDPGGFCRVCMHMICKWCCAFGCRTIEQRMTDMEQADIRSRQRDEILAS